MSTPTLPTLPSLPSILGDAAVDAVVPGLGTAMGAVSGLGGKNPILGIDVASAVAIVLGLVLIAAGVFSFKQVHETVVTAAKTAAVAA